VPTKQRAHCYKNYNKKVTLPEWDIDQERYWHVVTRYSIMEYPVYFYNKSYNLSKLTLLKTHQADHPTDITKYSILEYFVCCTYAKCVRWCFFLEWNDFFMGWELLFCFHLLYDLRIF
jgi:hypothetical protein